MPPFLYLRVLIFSLKPRIFLGDGGWTSKCPMVDSFILLPEQWWNLWTLLRSRFGMVWLGRVWFSLFWRSWVRALIKSIERLFSAKETSFLQRTCNYTPNVPCTKPCFAFTSTLQVKPSHPVTNSFKIIHPLLFYGVLLIRWNGYEKTSLCQFEQKRFWLPFRLKIVGAYIFNHSMSKSSRTHVHTQHTLTWECGSGGLLLTAGSHSTVAVWLNKSRLQHGKQIVLWVSDLSAALPKCQLAAKEIALFLMKHAVLTCLVCALGSKCNWSPFICTVLRLLLPPAPHTLNNCIRSFPAALCVV